MNYRHGTCTSCGAHFRVPATFQADRAKCKSCGGVVEIGPADAGEGAPAAPKASAPAAKPVPARPVPPRPPAAKATPPAAAPAEEPAAEKPAPRPAASRPAQADPVRAAAEAAAGRVRAAGKPGARSAPAGARGTSGRRPAGGAKGGAGKAAAGKEGAGRSSARGGRARPAAQKKSPLPIVAALVVLVAIIGAAAWFLTKDGGESAPAETTASAPDATTQPEAVEPAAVEPDPEPAEESAPTEEQAAEEQAAGEQAAGERAAEPAPSEAPPPDPDEIDLMEMFPDEGKLPGTSDEDWAQIQEWMASYIDPAAGAAGNRARAKLLERGRESFPAILNAFKRIDFSTEAGMRQGDLTQRLLTDICNGQNFDWRFDTQPENVVFNKKVVRAWIKAWEQGRDFPQAWAKLTKTEVADAEKLFEKTGPFTTDGGEPVRADSLDDF